MPISKKALQTLEYDKILRMLADACATEGARRLALELVPSCSLSEIHQLLAQTDDAKRFCTIKGQPSFGNIRDITDAVRRAQKGAVLSPAELLQILNVLQVVRG